MGSSCTYYPSLLCCFQFRDELADRLHFFAEECDNLQGFHILSDWDNGFGAVACSLAQEIRDEFGGKGLLVLPVSPRVQPLDKVGGLWELLTASS